MEFRIEQKWAHFSNTTNWITMEFVAAPCNGLKRFLSDRKQRVLIEWMSSDLASVNSGVPYYSLPTSMISRIWLHPMLKYLQTTVSFIKQINQRHSRLKCSWEVEKWLAGCNTPAEMYHHPYLKKRYPIKTSYQLHSHTLEETCYGASTSFQLRPRQLEQLNFWEGTSEIARMIYMYMIWHRQTTTQE